MDRIQVAAGGLRAQRSSASTRFSHDRAPILVHSGFSMHDGNATFLWLDNTIIRT